MSEDVHRTEGEPHDLLTRLANIGIDAITDDPNGQDVKVVIMISDPEVGRCGVGLSGYENDREAITDIFIHLEAIFHANNIDFVVGAMPIKGEG